MAVLQGQIQIGENVGCIPEGRQHLRREAGGVGVVHPDPGDLHLSESPQKLGQAGSPVEIKAVIGGDLADQDQLLHPLGRQGLGLGHDRFDRPGTLVAPQLRDDAKRAAIVAAFGHLEVGHRLGGGAVAGQMLIRHEGGHIAHLTDPLAGPHPPQHVNDVLVIARSHDRPGLRQRLQQLLPELLGQAAGDNELLALFRQFHQRAHRFRAGVLDETAGVHHDHRSLVLIGTHRVAGFGQQSEHVLGVHSVLLAAEVGEGDAGATRFWHGGGWRRSSRESPIPHPTQRGLPQSIRPRPRHRRDLHPPGQPTDQFPKTQ